MKIPLWLWFRRYTVNPTCFSRGIKGVHPLQRLQAAESRGVYAWEAQRWSADAARACHTGLAVLSSPQGADRSGASCARLWQSRAAARGPLVRPYDHGRDVGDGNEHTPSVRWGDAGIRVWERIGGVRSVSVSISKSIVHPGRADGRRAGQAATPKDRLREIDDVPLWAPEVARVSASRPGRWPRRRRRPGPASRSSACPGCG